MEPKITQSRYLLLTAWQHKTSLARKISPSMGNYIFREINNGLLRIVKSEYFAKQIIFFNSPARKL